MGEFNNGNPDKAFEYLGYATHYLQDVGCPLHTSADLLRAVALHKTYEDYVDANWGKFYPDAETASPYFSSTPQQAVISLAHYSHTYMEINYDGTWTGVSAYNGLGIWNTGKIDEWTHDMIQKTTGYTIGFYNYVYNNLPDLTITSDVYINGTIWSEDANIKAGQTVPINVTVRNTGGTAKNVNVTFFNDRDEIGKFTIPQINNNENKNAQISWTVKFPHVIKAVVDAENKIFEQNENNNEIVERLPDLMITSMWSEAGNTYGLKWVCNIYSSGEDTVNKTEEK
jgi:hypothetical protein